MRKKLCLIVMLVLFPSAVALSADERPSPFTLDLTPGTLIPIGTSSDLYTIGFGLGASGEYRFPSKPLFFVSGNAGYSHPAVQADTGLSIFSFGAGGGVGRDFGGRFRLKGFVNGGGYFASLFQESEFGTTSAFNPYLAVGTAGYYVLSKSLSLGLEVSYNNFFGLYNGIGLALGTSLHFGGKKKAGVEQPLRVTPLAGDHVELIGVEFTDVFPVFFKYYDDHAIGKAVLRNRTNDPVTDVSVNVLVKQYMDSPKECEAPSAVEGGKEHPLELYALFTERVLEITEGTKVAADITVQYRYKGEPYVYTKVATLGLFDRNATRWDDDRKAAAFVTAKDPTVLKFSKSVAGIVKENGAGAINEKLRTAMALHEALALYGVSYVVDPTTPYTEFSKNVQAVDYLQFPRQTMEYKAGDCDDLSILTTALLESVGIETAFITTPGHIFVAFSTDMAPEEGKKSFLRNDSLIFIEEKTWIPVEVTSTNGGFLKAWELGASLWREASAQGKADFFPVREAWRLYNPVGLPGEGNPAPFPKEDSVASAYLKELAKFVDREVYPQAVKLEAEIRKDSGNLALPNKLGVLYARYGLLEKAESEFKKTLARDGNYVPALLNLGNVYLLKGDNAKAKDCYEKAAALEPENPKALLCVARVNHSMENFGTVRQVYAKLKTLDPELASRFAYLDMKGDEAVRAAEASKAKEVMVWSD